MAAQQGGQGGRDQAPRDAAGHVDVEPAGRLALAGLEQLVDVLDLGQQGADPLQQLRTVGGQAYLARGPMQQPGADLALQLLDRGGYGGARQLQRVGRLDEAAHLRDLGEDTVLVESVHEARFRNAPGAAESIAVPARPPYLVV